MMMSGPFLQEVIPADFSRFTIFHYFTNPLRRSRAHLVDEAWIHVFVSDWEYEARGCEYLYGRPNEAQSRIRVCKVMKMTGRAEKADRLCCFGMVRQSCFLFGTGHYAPTASGVNGLRSAAQTAQAQPLTPSACRSIVFSAQKKKNGGFLCFCKKY